MNDPKILAPAGDNMAFLAAIAAGADAIYCGLKLFTARMAADNFSIEALGQLSHLAHDRGIHVYIALNTLIKESEQEKAFRLLVKLCRHVRFEALIIQDLSLIPLAKQAGFNGEFHLSTLGNLTLPAGLQAAADAGFTRVVLPREFSLDDIREMAAHRPAGLDLEVFVHGALCYAVSGRCYWSSWFGGKSALRGRCVQPCRRIYRQKGPPHRHFSCLDFSADVLAKVLKTIDGVSTWKIEGRKKGAHYVYYTTRAFRILRDAPHRKKEALAYLDDALGRPVTHHNLLSHRRQSPLDHQSRTESGKFLGCVKQPAAPFFIPRAPLMKGDLLRIGNEEDRFHATVKVTRSVPGKARFKLPASFKFKAKSGTPVHLIDRRDPELSSRLTALSDLLNQTPRVRTAPAGRTPDPPGPSSLNRMPSRFGRRVLEMHVSRNRKAASRPHTPGYWISSSGYRVPPLKTAWLWLDPVIFPDDAPLCRDYIATAVKKGATRFVVNSPWQIRLFHNPETLTIWAGPFCNITNTRAVGHLHQLGFSGAIVSPELDRDTLVSLPDSSPLPLGVVIKGNWPLAVSRIVSPQLSLGTLFQSPKNEGAWVSRHGNTFYVYPAWPLDLTPHRGILAGAGYSCFVTLTEPVPRGVQLTQRPGEWNWQLTLL